MLNHRVFFLILIIVSAVSACAMLPERPKWVDRSVVRVGYLVRHAHNPTHSYMGISIKRYDNISWDLTSHLKKTLYERLSSEENFIALDLDAYGFEPQDLANFFRLEGGKFTVPSGNAELLDKLRTEYNLDYLVHIYPHTEQMGINCMQYGCDKVIDGVGTGLITLPRGTGIEDYTARINLGLKFDVYDIENVFELSQYAPTNTPSGRFHIEHFQQPKDLNNITETEWQQVYDQILIANVDLSNRIIANIKGIEKRCWKYKPKPGDKDFQYGPEQFCTTSQ